MTAERASIVGYRDLREWLAAVDGMGELKTVSGVHWDREMGAMVDMCYRARGSGKAPAIMFDDVPGYPHGYQCLYGMMASPRRFAFTVGGIDVSTNLPFEGVLTAPEGSTVVTPLTSLIVALVESGAAADAAEAESLVAAALGLPPDVALTAFGPVDAALAGDPDGLEVYAAGVQVAVFDPVDDGGAGDAEPAGESAFDCHTEGHRLAVGPAGVVPEGPGCAPLHPGRPPARRRRRATA